MNDATTTRRVFLDIGAHVGETLAVVRRPRWRFAEIHCFEPAPSCWPRLHALADGRVTVWPVGLSDEDRTAELFGAGSIGASLSAEKGGQGDPVVCELRDAGTWFAEHAPGWAGAEVFAKINVEGAEPEIVSSLAAAGALARIDHLLIHFDVRKVPGRAPLEAQVRQQLTSAGVEYVEASRFIHGDVARGTRNWLVWCGLRSPATRRAYEVLRAAEGRARVALYPVKGALGRLARRRA